MNMSKLKFRVSWPYFRPLNLRILRTPMDAMGQKLIYVFCYCNVQERDT